MSDTNSNYSRVRSYLGLAGFLIFTLVFGSTLLVLNAGFVYSFYSAVSRSLPDWATLPQVTQFVLYVLPMALLFVEMYLIDTLIDRVRRFRGNA